VEWGVALDWTRLNESFQEIGVYNYESSALGSDGPSEWIQVLQSSSGVFAALNVPPALGRVLTPVDDEVGGVDVVVLSDALWIRAFGADPDIVGRTIHLNGEPFREE
jgi:hypothetical protein